MLGSPSTARPAGLLARSPLTNGCVRVLSNPRYPTVETSPGEIASRLRVLCAAADHHFWEDSLSLLDEARFRASLIPSHRSITDLYLLALAVAHRGKLATFDRSIPLKPVVGAEPRHLALLGSAR